MHCCGSLHLFHQGKTFHFKRKNQVYQHVYWKNTLCGHELQMSGKCISATSQHSWNSQGQTRLQVEMQGCWFYPLEYSSDNDTAFTFKSYAACLSNCSQTQQFAGVGAHHHNGVAIQTIMSIARTMMLHSAIHLQKSPTPPCGPRQSNIIPISTTMSQIPLQSFAQMISSSRHDGSKENSITFMFGDVHSMFWTRQSLMERNSHIGNQELLKESPWV